MFLRKGGGGSMSRFEQLKKLCQNTITPDHVVMAVLSKLKTSSIPKDPAIIHKGFYHLKLNENYKELTKDFFFNMSGLTPFSELLDEILFKLETASVLSTTNPSYEKYELNKLYLDDAFNRFDSKKQETIIEMSKDFEDSLPK